MITKTTIKIAKSVGTSNRQLFKQAGNSIAANVIYHILKNLF